MNLETYRNIYAYYYNCDALIKQKDSLNAYKDSLNTSCMLREESYKKELAQKNETIENLNKEIVTITNNSKNIFKNGSLTIGCVSLTLGMILGIAIIK